MLIEYISQKKNFITCSEYSDAPLSLFENSFRTRPQVLWTVGKDRPFAWIKLNTLTPVDLKTIYYDWVGDCTAVKAFVSHDDLNWNELKPNGDPRDGSYTGIDFVFFKLLIVEPKENFQLIDLKVSGDVDMPISDRFISVVADNFFPQGFFENNPLIPAFVTDYLRMLEDGKDTLARNIPADFKLDFRINIRAAFIGGAINMAPINSIAINGMVYHRDDSNTIDFYVEPDPESEWADAVYVWNFDDPFATPQNPNIVVKRTSIGYTTHSFQHLGTYYVTLVGRLKDGRTVEVVKLLEFTRAGDVIPPDLVVNEPDTSTFNPFFEFTGTTEPGAMVKAILRNATTDAVVNEDGTWTVSVTDMVLGVNSVMFVATDAAGNSTNVSRVITVEDPLQTLSLDPVPEQFDTPTLVISGDVGENIEVSVIVAQATTTYVATIANGKWSATINANIGPLDITVRGVYTPTSVSKELYASSERLTVPFTFTLTPPASPTYLPMTTITGTIANGGTITAYCDTLGTLPGLVIEGTEAIQTWSITVQNIAEGENQFSFHASYEGSNATLTATVKFEKKPFGFIVQLPGANFVPRIIPYGNDFLATTYSATGSAVWNVLNNGTSWNKLGSFYPEVDAHGLVLLGTQTVLVGTSNGGKIFRSTNGGVSFDAGRRLGSETIIGCLCKINDTTVVAGTGNSGQIWKSMDGGKNWIVKQRLGVEVLVQTIVRISNGVLLAGTSNGGQIWASNDDGETWRLVADCGSEFRVKAFTEVAPGVILAGTYPGGQIWRTSDYGNNWTFVTQLGSEQHVNTLASNGDGTAFAGTGNHAQIWQTVDNGTTWSLYQTIPGETIVYTIALNNGVAVAGTYPSAKIYTL